MLANLYKQNPRQIRMVKRKVGEHGTEPSASMPKTSSLSEQAKHEKHQPLEHKLLENLVELQKVHTTLAEKFDKLAEQISELLALFEKTARSFGEHPANQVAEKDREFLDKVDKLLEQNKTIAKALTLVEERVRERMYGVPPRMPSPASASPGQESQEYAPSPPAKPLPRF